MFNLVEIISGSGELGIQYEWKSRPGSIELDNLTRNLEEHTNFVGYLIPFCV